MSCRVHAVGLHVKSTMAPGVVCRIMHFRMKRFDWVMVRGLKLKKNLELFIFCQEEKSYIISDNAYFIIRFYK